MGWGEESLFKLSWSHDPDGCHAHTVETVVVVLVFYGLSTHFKSFRARSVNLSTLFLGQTPGQFNST